MKLFGKLSVLFMTATVAAGSVTMNGEDKLLVIGDGVWGRWSLDRSAVMVRQSDSPEVFTYMGYLRADEEFKFLTQAKWDEREYRNASAEPYLDATGNLCVGCDDNKFKVRESANYTVSCNLDDMTVSVTKSRWQDAPIYHNVLYLVGDATPGGWDLGKSTPLTQSTSNPWMFSGRVSLTNVGDNRTASFKIATNCYGGYNEQKFYFRAAEDSNKVSEDSTDDRQWSVDRDGVYDVTVDLSTMSISLENVDPAGRLCWYEPAEATPADKITLYYNAALGNGALKGLQGDVYAHCGVLTDESVSASDWKHSSGWGDNDPKYRLTRSASDPDMYTLEMTPMSFFNLTEGETLRSMVFVMRNADGSVSGRGEGGSDIVAPFKNGSTAPDPRRLGQLRSWSEEGPTVTVRADEGDLVLTAYNSSVIKVFTRFSGTVRDERRSISVSASPEGKFTVADKGDALELSTGDVTVNIAKADCRVTFRDAAGTDVLREKEGLDNSTFPRRVSFEGMQDRAFYGGGYNGKRIDHNNQVLTMNNTQTGGWDATWDAPHNICIPFVVSSEGYGLLFDDHYRGARLCPSADGTTYTSQSKSPISYYYIAGKDGSMGSVLEQYTFLTGRQELPPYWALGYMTSRYGYANRAESEEVVDNIKKKGLPLDAIVFDLYWQGRGNSGMGNLDWNPTDWPDAGGMMDGFLKKGVRTVCITEPFFTSVAATNYNELKNAGFFADDDVSGMGWLGADKVGLIDASNPEAMDWMWEFYKKRTQEGVGGWWLDLGEPESHDNDSYHRGGTVSEIHNEFGNLWLERVYRGFKEEFPEVRPFLMPRAGTSGMQRHSAFPWSGDIRRSWAGLQAQIPALLSSGMSGVAYMGSDVGGFANDQATDSWLYRRWVQMAVFSPMMRTHSTYLPEPYQDCYADVFEDVKNAINLRDSYLPYTYTLAWENAVKGTPLARPLNFHDREGMSPADCKDEYLWGKDLLVAPVVEFNNGSSGDELRQIVFPEGEWVDMNDMSKSYKGGTTVSYDAPHSVLPHFGRRGSFITRFSQESFDHTGNVDNTRLTVTYLMDSEAAQPVSSVLFDDDHVSTRTLENNQMLLTEFTGQNTNTGHVITVSHTGSYEGMPQSRFLTFVIPGYSRKIGSVTASDGSVFTEDSSSSSVRSADASTYRIDGNVVTLRAKVPTTGTYSLSISSEISALEAPVASVTEVFEFSEASRNYSYQLPAGTDASIVIYNMGGSEVGRIMDLSADGTVHQAAAPSLPGGVYMSTLMVNDPARKSLASTIKTCIR